ncbi:hypothetical protein [Pseudoalteromonas rubra]|uniref:Uncharacterized protein n=1 Tax=Pseudoalteromonas rubra TaxID=43658 RepID=A0A0F4QJU8_9GAMM|nr:hypothetical protein [Pseudoalteromonas rubra]KJZ07599.1 hypothetical protein TW77_14985 [Pseudoalteromonas rubra]
MSKLLNDPMLVAAATGVNTIAIAVIQYGHFDASLVKTLSISVPVMVNLTVFFLYWIGVWFGIKSPEQLKAEQAIDDKIKSLHKGIKHLQSLKHCTKAIEKELSDAYIAKANISNVLKK